MCGLAVSSSARTDAGVWLLVARTAHAANAAPVVLTLSPASASRDRSPATKLEDSSGVDSDALSPSDKVASAQNSRKPAVFGAGEDKLAESVSANKVDGDLLPGGKVLSSSVSVSSSSSSTSRAKCSPLLLLFSSLPLCIFLLHSEKRIFSFSKFLYLFNVILSSFRENLVFCKIFSQILSDDMERKEVQDFFREASTGKFEYIFHTRELVGKRSSKKCKQFSSDLENT